MKELKNVNVQFLERKSGTDSFIEAYQASSVTEYCLLDDEYCAIHPQVRCKDYLQDLFWIAYTEKNIKEEEKKDKGRIYGFYPFSYDTSQLKNKELYKVGIRYREKNGQTIKNLDLDKCLKIKSILNDFEKSIDFPLSDVKTDLVHNILVFEFNSKWTTKPYLLSFYLLIIRILFTEEDLNFSGKKFLKYLLDFPSKKSGNDSSILRKSEYLLKKFISKEFPEQSWNAYNNLYNIHDTSGISSYSGYLKTQNDLLNEQKQPVEEKEISF